MRRNSQYQRRTFTASCGRDALSFNDQYILFTTAGGNIISTGVYSREGRVHESQYFINIL